MKKVLTISILFVLLLISNSFGDSNSQLNKYNGYRSHPFGDRQAYHEYYNGYHYKGHWRSWDDWEHFKRQHPNYHRYGRYEKINEHLYFMFDNGFDKFIFSIGR